MLELLFLREQESDSGKVRRQTSGGHPRPRLCNENKEAASALIRFCKADIHHAAYHSREKAEVPSGKLTCS